MSLAFLLRRSSRIAGAYVQLNLLPTKYRRLLKRLPQIGGPALVVGSAPDPATPAGVTSGWFRISANASQGILDRFGLPPPDLTVFRSRLADDQPDAAAIAAWTALRGRSTGHLLVGSEGPETAARIIAAHAYRAAQITELRNSLRGAIIADVLGEYLTIATNANGVSNGVFAAVLAVKLGAAPVVMAGFSLSGGWSHAPDINSPRYHQDGDRRACRLMREKGLPVFTSDEAFAAATGLPLWQGAENRIDRAG
jgi:hypothetical protein